MKILILLMLFLLMPGCSKEMNVSVNIDDFKQERYYIKTNIDKYIDYSLLNNENISDIVKEVNVGLYRDYYDKMVESDLSKDIKILVNKYHYLKSEYIPKDLEEISNNCNVGINNYLRHEARIEFERLCSDAKKDNIYIYNLSAYRSYEKQLKIYNNKLKSKDKSIIESISARPGNSEHQTGLTVDINLLSKEFDKTNEYNWMINNSYKYGFILRYPKDSEKITGYTYEPWHFRYIGKDAALIVNTENITFDEYYAYYIENN